MLYSKANPSPLIFGELDSTMSGHFGMGKTCLKVRQALGTCQVSYVSIILTMQYSQNPTTLSRVNISSPLNHPNEVSIRIHKLSYQGNVSRPRPSDSTRGSWPAPPKGRTHLTKRCFLSRPIWSSAGRHLDWTAFR